VRDDIKINTVFRAVGLAGGLGNLSRLVRVSQIDLLGYAAGTPMPQAVFLKLVDYILADEHFAQSLADGKRHLDGLKPD
jgi:hypothetical protein